jgi:myxalamid-type polyketide synthase MxaE and MxaD
MAVDAAINQSCLSAVAVAQALGARPRPPRLWLITQHAAGPDVKGVWQAPLWGLGRVVMNELPELRCGLIDVSDAIQAAPLVDEVLASTTESQVVLRARQRLVARLEPLYQRSSSQGQPAAPPFAARPEATYLITGAFGGLALALAQWLARKGARHLLLVGRREPSLEAQAVLDQLRAEEVDVHLALADVAERDQLARALAALDQMPPLAGVVHAAGTLDDGLIVNLDRGRFDRVVRPKIHGAWHLHELTQGQALDFFVLPSSIAAVFGSPGQANHAAASAFLDGLAAYRRHLGLPGLSLNWGPWASIGAAAGKPSADRVIAAGMSPIETDWGLDVLEHMLGVGQPQAAVMAVDWGRWFRAFPTLAGAPLLADLAREHASAVEGSGAPGAMAAQLSALARPEERRDFLQTLLTRQIAQVLRLPPAQVDPDTPFGSLGFDSLMALEVKNGLERQLGLVLPVSLVWNYPTVTELTGYLASELGVRLEPDPAVTPQTIEPEADALAGLSEDEIMDLLNDKLARLNRSL